MRGLAGFAVLVGLWDLLRLAHVLPPTAAPASWDIARALADPSLAVAAGDTLLAWAGGLLLAGVLGIAAGILLGVSRWADAATRVVIDFLRPIPAVALIPVAVVVIGLGAGMQAVLVAFACLWPLLISTRFGVRDVDPLLVETGRVFGASGLRLAATVTGPAAVPAIRTGLRTAASLGLVVAVATELVAGSPGLGWYIAQQQQAGQIPAAYAGIVVAGSLGYVIHLVFDLSAGRAVSGRAVSRRSVSGRAFSGRR
ncbi:ABC transporter permease [Actinoplanes palleronii]|uniref:Nitrate ABC transporter permease n=1 Tax=Actinoplanes palleronii TaxID=113570 RepID=A0ABQ4BH79_9ACTN|nr:ABC transporter permease subunit [Actinoplanes palleronii]GIE70018.1 nitrate ABC transporter permease [Actinoplanes palleronii]